MEKNKLDRRTRILVGYAAGMFIGFLILEKVFNADRVMLFLDVLITALGMIGLATYWRFEKVETK